MKIAQVVSSYHRRIGGVETHVRVPQRWTRAASLALATGPDQLWMEGRMIGGVSGDVLRHVD